MSAPPPRSRLVAEIIAVIDHAQPLFSCWLLEEPMRIERHELGGEATYSVAACGIKYIFQVTCPHHGAIAPDDCRVSDR